MENKELEAVTFNNIDYAILDEIDNYYNFIDPDTLDSLDAAEDATKEYNNKQIKDMAYNEGGLKPKSYGLF